jgi:hypothetical protein
MSKPSYDRWSVRQCLVVRHPSETVTNFILIFLKLRVRYYGALTEYSTSLQYTVASGPRQRGLSRVRFSRDS